MPTDGPGPSALEARDRGFILLRQKDQRAGKQWRAKALAVLPVTAPRQIFFPACLGDGYARPLSAR